MTRKALSLELQIEVAMFIDLLTNLLCDALTVALYTTVFFNK